ncbi:MAG TPA: SIS domain-containing protein [Actinomycetota bacterium]|nr:SIS domain-containing protein [Actinomycetota bacterium]
MSTQAGTNLEGQIRSQPDELSRLLTSEGAREQVHAAAEGLRRARRIWLVGTGTSHHAAILGAGMLQDAGRSAVAVSSMRFVVWAPIVGPDDTIVVITHTGETAYALAARALATTAGVHVVTITKRGAAFPHAVETCPKETAETYTVSYTTALLTLALIAKEMGADSITDDTLALVPAAVASAIESPGTEAIAAPERVLVIAGAGPAATTAREGALKVREGARMLAEGYDAEFLLHGSAVPLDPRDAILALTTPDTDGFVQAVAAAGAAEGIRVHQLAEPAPLPMLLAQIPLTVRLQLLALRFALERGQDPDTVITGNWADERLWLHGRPDL